ncbi:hypothetical protein DH2020_024902 [Rehmannia glutinosa]|uniref:Bifunctional inhibitor/plant lipid transfer protein/seed storage helical domain-containing protein n=1 Tax=Rehmannia glutinosa TaxID=99300 RepID=A0ABR0W211_REHGL
MAYKAILFLALLSVLSTKTTAQSSCKNTLMGLSPCLNYVTGNSSSPSSSCCSQLSNVVQSQPQCLCLLMNGAASSYGININQTLALALPGVCNVQTPPLSRCNDVNAPTGSPVTPQSPPADSTKAPETKPSGSDVPSGSKTVIGGSNVQAPSNVVILVLFVASYALFVAGF